MVILAQNKEVMGDGGTYEILPLKESNNYGIFKVDGERPLTMGIYNSLLITRNVFNGIVMATANGERVFYMPEEDIDETWKYVMFQH